MKRGKLIGLSLGIASIACIFILAAGYNNVIKIHEKANGIEVDTTVYKIVIDTTDIKRRPWISFVPLNKSQRNRSSVAYLYLSSILRSDISRYMVVHKPPVIYEKLPKNMLFPGTNVYNAEKILRLLDSIRIERNKDGICWPNQNIIVGIIEENIAIPCKNKSMREVIGYSHKGGMVCVVSRYKLDDNDEFGIAVCHEVTNACFGSDPCPYNISCAATSMSHFKDEDIHNKLYHRLCAFICDSCKRKIHRLIKVQ